MAVIQRTRLRTALLLVAGCTAAILWMLIAELFGTPSARAESRPAGLADDLISVVEEAVPAAAPLVSDVATAVAPIVDPVEEVLTPVQQQVVAPLAPVLAPVQQIAESAPAAAVITPVVDAVATVPVVGDIVTGLGVDDAAGAVTEAVDTVAGGLVPAVAGTLPSAEPLPAPALPVPGSRIPAGDGWMAAPALPPRDGEAAASADPAPALTVAFTAARTLLDVALGSLVESWTAGAATTISASSPATPSSPLNSLPAPLSGTGSSFAGPGVTGIALWALVAAASVFAHRAWVRRHGLTDDTLPAGPVGKADVSPD